MRKIRKDMRLFILIRDFLTEYLPKQRFCSENTISSYRTAINLLLDYLCMTLNCEVEQITFDCISAETLSGFLDYLENERSCSASTRNQRLACIRSFYQYAGRKDCSLIAKQQELLNVPLKKTKKSLAVNYLDEESLSRLLLQPDPQKPKEFRNLFYMVLMYDTGCRNQEILDLKLSDIHSGGKAPYIVVTGKGNKTRVVPIMPKTVQYFEKYRALFHERSQPNSYLFYTVSNNTQRQMSPDNVARFMKQYGEQAFPDGKYHLHPHMLRHTRAMHLYRAGMPLVLIAEWLGHSQLETTMIYAYADTEMKRAAIQKATSPQNPLNTVSFAATTINSMDAFKTLYGLK